MMTGNALHGIARLRMASQQIARPRLTSPRELVASMGAMQAQDFRMALWAIGLRLPGSSADAVRLAYDRGEIIRTHLLRPTWHFVAAEDLRWMLDLSGPRLIASLRSRHRTLGLTDRVFETSGALLEKALRGKVYLTREELVAVLAQAGLPADVNRGWHLLLRAELEGIICSGPLKEGRPTCALIAERIPPAGRRSREEALATLGARYFATRAPATVQDFAWWSGLTAADARAALEMVRRDFTPLVIGARTHWVPARLRPPLRPAGSLQVLPSYDEFLISYRDRSAQLSGVRQSRLVSTNGIFYPVIVIDGIIAGTWRREQGKGMRLVEAKLFKRCSPATARALNRAFGRYGRFEGVRVAVTLRGA